MTKEGEDYPEYVECKTCGKMIYVPSMALPGQFISCNAGVKRCPLGEQVTQAIADLNALKRTSGIIQDDDSINPAHYKKEVGECIDAMRALATEEEFRAHCRLTAFKYLWRAKDKGDEIENYRKAIWYLTFATGVDPREAEEEERTTVKQFRQGVMGESDGD